MADESHIHALMTRDSSATYVSRGGVKLAAALDHFTLDVKGCVCADLGSHVGGFVDCLLARGAVRVYAVDTCYGTLAWKLRRDPRVVTMERRNAMHVSLPEPVNLVTVDVGWTPQVNVLPNVARLMRTTGTNAQIAATTQDGGDEGTQGRWNEEPSCDREGAGHRREERTMGARDQGKEQGGAEGPRTPGAASRPGSAPESDYGLPSYDSPIRPAGLVLTLIKPHYEAPRLSHSRGRDERGKETGAPRQTAGVTGLVDGVLSDGAYKAVVEAVLAEIRYDGWCVAGTFESPIRGHAGNREIFALLTRSKSG